MKTDMQWKRRVVLVLGAFVLIVGCAWLLREPRGEPTGVALAFVTSTTNGSLGEASFRIYNDSPRAIFLSWVVVEQKTTSGWRVLDKREPKDPRVVDVGKSMEVPIAVRPELGRWRLKVIYGTENRGPELLLTKAELGIRSRSTSGLGSVGVFTGQKTVIAEVSR